jgi:hypothetical protein
MFAADSSQAEIEIIYTHTLDCGISFAVVYLPYT